MKKDSLGLIAVVARSASVNENPYLHGFKVVKKSYDINFFAYKWQLIGMTLCNGCGLNRFILI